MKENRACFEGEPRFFMSGQMWLAVYNLAKLVMRF